MSNRASLFILLAVAALLIGSCAVNSKVPAWAGSEPVDPLYYSTVVKVTKADPNYKNKALDTALKNIAMQITVTVDASVTTRETESWGLTATDFNSSIQTSSRAQLTGVELAGAHETKKEYWAWYRLNKLSYRDARQRMCANSMRVAADLLSKYDAALESEKVDFSQASSFLIKALDELSDYVDMDLRTLYAGKEVHLYTELLHRLGNLAAGLELQMQPPLIQAVARRSNDLKARVVCEFGQKPCVSMPLSVSFTRGAGDVVPGLVSGSGGVALLVIKRITSYDRQQTVTIAPDTRSMIESATHPLVKKMLAGLNFKQARLDLEVRKPRVALVYSFNGVSTVNASLIRDRLRELDLEVVEDQAAGDYIMRIEVSSKPGAFIPSLSQHSANADARVNLIDGISGDVLASESLMNVKATGANASQAEKSSELAVLRAINQDLIYRLVSTYIIGF